jgi:hypothetical protein
MTDEHAAAKAMYEDYLARCAVLERHRRFANDVLKATSGPGQTPVEPLATMGKGGGPLLCDVCRKPMKLEGGAYQGVYADEAWRRNPKAGWVSWISGGLVVAIESNGTLRSEDFRARSKPEEVSAKLALLRAYFKAELPEKATDAVMSEIYAVLFVYDPGLGVNALE